MRAAKVGIRVDNVDITVDKVLLVSLSQTKRYFDNEFLFGRTIF